ncbi:hypothetical protein HDV01_000309 [Terramyces sp. JEL0728]|nr:hypothetical protein HDV01_000309 [Terramyces sp. JEL0728]
MVFEFNADVLIATYPDAKSKISAYVHEVYETSMKVQVVEVPENCGSAEALRTLKPLIKMDFMVLSCDLITDVPPNVLINSFRVQNRTMCALLYDSGNLETGDKKNEDVEFIGIHDRTSTLLFMESKADIGDDDLDIRSSLINKFQAIHLHSQLRDGHLYLFKRWVLELVVKNRNVVSIKSDLVPLLLEAQHRKLVYTREGIEALQDEHSQDIFAKARLLSLSGNRAPSKVSCTAVCYLQGFTARANTVWSYSEINRTLAKNTPSNVPQATEISLKTQIGNDSLIGESTRIDERCSVKRSVIGNHVKIGKNCKINNSVIMDYVSIEDGKGNDELIQNAGGIKMSTEFFLTAKNTQPWYRVAYGFYATSVGAGVIFAVPSFIVPQQFGGGLLGLITYPFFSGFPIFLVAIMGKYIRQRFPEVLSIGSFARWRFGSAFQTWVTLNVLFNLGIALAVEFTSIGTLFSNFLDVPNWIPIMNVAVVTFAYTALGGLYISLITDQVQTLFIFLILCVMGVFVAVNFRTGELGPLPDYLGINYTGEASFATLGIALISSTMFSDAVWQRVWSAKDDRALNLGAAVGGTLVIFVSFLFGFGGFIAAWAGLVTDPNVAFLQLLKVGDGDIPYAVLLVVFMLAVTMNESAIDSFQIAIGDTLVSLFESFGVKITIFQVRILLALLNIPFAIIGSYNFNIVSLYLITNIMTTCVMLPLVFGLIPAFDRYYTGASALFGSFFALIWVMIYGVLQQVYQNNGGVFNGWSDISTGLYNTFYLVYDYPPFVIGLGGSLVGMAIWTGGEEVYYRYIAKKERPIPAHWETPIEDAQTANSSEIAPVAAVVEKEL